MADFMDEEAQVSSGEEEEMSGENPFTFNNLTSGFSSFCSLFNA